RPRSPAESTLTLRNGVGNRVPFLMTRSSPDCRQTNNLPSGAKAIAVGLEMPVTTVSSENPAGTVAGSTRSPKVSLSPPSVQLASAKTPAAETTPNSLRIMRMMLIADLHDSREDREHYVETR